MTEPVQYHKFNCDVCDKDVTLRHYPNGTYDKYSVFMDCTTHNCFMPMRLYFCRKCGENVRKLIEELKKQGGSLMYFCKEGAPDVIK